jgi:type III pantothenate kinase
MRLLLDIGNTRLKWQLDSGHVLTSAEALAHDGQPAQAIAALAPRLAGQRIEQTCVAHVMGAAHEAAVSTEVQRLCREAPRYARCLAEFDGLRIAYAEPARLGVDRWLMLLAQWHAHRAAGAVASAGTALTYDAVDDTGQHLGGVIAPGLSVMMDATLGRTRFAAGEIVPEFSAGLGQNTEA